MVMRHGIISCIGRYLRPDYINSTLFAGEGEEILLNNEEENIPQQKVEVELLRSWIQKQRFIPHDLSDELLTLFLSATNFDVQNGEEKIRKYFYSRQEPSFLFRDRDPLSPGNVNIFKKLYVLPVPDTTEDGRKIILTGLVKPTPCYDQMEHAKALAMVLDLLIWERDLGSGDFVIVFDGRGFECPNLLENKVAKHRSITNLLLDTIPGTLRSFYLIYPPSYVANVADSRNGIWISVVKSKMEMLSYLPADNLPLEFGGNMGHLGDLTDQWNLHMAQSRDFFIHFENRMINNYQRRLCHEEELAKAGKNGVYIMKLEANEWEYKIHYYEKMRHAKPLSHPGFGNARVLRKKNIKPLKNPLERCRKLAKEQEDAARVFEPPKLYNGYAKELRKAKMTIEYDGEDYETVTQVDVPPPSAPLEEESPKLQTEGSGWEVEERHNEEEEEEEEEEEKVKSDSEPEIDFQEELIQFNQWLEREPYLPKNLDEEILITFLWDSESVEEAEAKLMNYFYVRQSMRSVFHERHPCSPNNLLKYDAVCVVPLTTGLDKKWIIFATWLSHEDPIKFNIYHMAKLIFTELDILLQENQIRGKTISVIIDMKGYTEEHTQMITRFAAKKICYLFTDCFPAKFNGFYILNPPEHVADYTVLFGPFDFHIVEYLEDLPGFLPKKFLTSDMAGEPHEPTRNSLFEPFFKRMRRCGNWLAYEEFIRSQEMMLRMTTTREEFNYGVKK